MSRTYRNKTTSGYYTGRREFDGRNKHWIVLGYDTIYTIETWEEYTLNIHKDGADWNMSTPSWWIHDTSTIKERQQTRNLINKVYTLIDYEESPEFPLDKKPYEYYW